MLQNEGFRLRRPYFAETLSFVGCSEGLGRGWTVKKTLILLTFTTLLKMHYAPNFWPAPLQKCVGDFCCIFFGGFAGDFPGGFFRALFPTKMRRKNPATKSAKKSSGPKIKIREKSVLPNSTFEDALRPKFGSTISTPQI